jgi:hypothetical protein
MAGGGISLTPGEHDALRRLSRGDMSNLLTTLDEDGWREAQTMLRRLDARGGYKPVTEGETP